MRESLETGIASLFLAGALCFSGYDANAALTKEELARCTPLEKQLIRHEGYANGLYYVLGVPHVGVGFNLTRGDAEKKLKEVGADYVKVKSGQQTLNDQQVMTLFRQDVTNATSGARSLIKNYDLRPEEVQLVTADLVYNMGTAKVKEFPRTLKDINSGNYASAAARLKKSLWYGQVKERGRYLTTMLASLGNLKSHSTIVKKKTKHS